MAHLTNEPYLEQRNITNFLIEFADGLLRDTRLFILFPKVDIIIVGGSALAMKYNFRSTVDIDAQIKCNFSVDKHIERMANKYKIPRDWINEDFTKSPSYSPNLGCDATLAMTRAFGTNRVDIYVVSDLNQLCMKTVACRDKDIYDIMKLLDMIKMSSKIKYRDYAKRMIDLYGGAVTVPKEVDTLLRNVLK